MSVFSCLDAEDKVRVVPSQQISFLQQQAKKVNVKISLCFSAWNVKRVTKTGWNHAREDTCLPFSSSYPAAFTRPGTDIVNMVQKEG